MTSITHSSLPVDLQVEVDQSPQVVEEEEEVVVLQLRLVVLLRRRRRRKMSQRRSQMRCMCLFAWLHEPIVDIFSDRVWVCILPARLLLQAGDSCKLHAMALLW